MDMAIVWRGQKEGEKRLGFDLRWRGDCRLQRLSVSVVKRVGGVLRVPYSLALSLFRSFAVSLLPLCAFPRSSAILPRPHRDLVNSERDALQDSVEEANAVY